MGQGDVLAIQVDRLASAVGTDLVVVGIPVQEGDTIQVEHHRACWGSQDPVGIPEGRSAGHMEDSPGMEVAGEVAGDTLGVVGGEVVVVAVAAAAAEIGEEVGQVVREVYPAMDQASNHSIQVHS